MYSANEKYDALIKRYLDGQCSQDEAFALLSWIAESEENRVYFESFKDVWTLTNFSMDEDNNVESALAKVNLKIDEAEAETKTVQMPWLRRNYKYVSGVAAAIVVALFFGFLISKPFNPTVTVAYNESQPEMTYQLPDGSSFTFDNGGEISYPKQFGKDERSVNFEGKAYFDVAKDAEHPFVIHCDGLDVEVLGTSFMLEANEEKHVVDLYSGQVRMTAVDKYGEEITHIDLKPNERGLWSAKDAELKVMTYAEVKQEELANDHVLDFNNVSLSTIAEALEFIYEIEVKLPEAYVSEKVTIRFSEEDSANEVIETIATVFGLEVSHNENTYLIH